MGGTARGVYGYRFQQGFCRRTNFKAAILQSGKTHNRYPRGGLAIHTQIIDGHYPETGQELSRRGIIPLDFILPVRDLGRPGVCVSGAIFETETVFLDGRMGGRTLDQYLENRQLCVLPAREWIRGSRGRGIRGFKPAILDSPKPRPEGR